MCAWVDVFCGLTREKVQTRFSSTMFAFTKRILTTSTDPCHRFQLRTTKYLRCRGYHWLELLDFRCYAARMKNLHLHFNKNSGNLISASISISSYLLLDKNQRVRCHEIFHVKYYRCATIVTTTAHRRNYSSIFGTSCVTPISLRRTRACLIELCALITALCHRNSI